MSQQNAYEVEWLEHRERIIVATSIGQAEQIAKQMVGDASKTKNKLLRVQLKPVIEIKVPDGS
jgi:hypothetical protein